MVKNVMTLRFGNPIFGALWDCNHIDNVQVSPQTRKRVSSWAHDLPDIHDWSNWNWRSRRLFWWRGHHQRCHAESYICPWAGRNTLADSTPSDLMQLMALTTMERPGSFTAEDLRQEKVKHQIMNSCNFWHRKRLGFCALYRLWTLSIRWLANLWSLQIVKTLAIKRTTAYPKILDVQLFAPA